MFFDRYTKYRGIVYSTTVLEIKEYIDTNGHNNFVRWFNLLNTDAALKIRKYLARLATPDELIAHIEKLKSGNQK
jgi:hypothetical protein